MKNIAEFLGSFTDFLYLCSVVEGRVKEIIILNSQLKKSGMQATRCSWSEGVSNTIKNITKV